MTVTLPPEAQAWSDLDKDLYRMRASWLQIARPNQIPPLGDWRVWLLLAGRGFGKTRTAAEDVAYEGLRHPHWRIGVVAPTFASMRDVCFEGKSGVLKWIPEKYVVKWNRSIGELFLVNGTIFRGFAGDEPDRLRGPEFNRTWVDELAAMSQQEECWMNVEMCTRLPPRPQIIVTTTPRPTKTVRSLKARSVPRLAQDPALRADFRKVGAEKTPEVSMRSPYLDAMAFL